MIFDCSFDLSLLSPGKNQQLRHASLMVELSLEWTQYKHRRSRYYVTGNQETFSTETMTLILHPIIINQTWPVPGWCLEKIPKTRKSFDFQIPLVYWLMSPFLPWHLIGGKVHLIFYRPLNWMRCQGRCWRMGLFLPWQLITSSPLCHQGHQRPPLLLCQPHKPCHQALIQGSPSFCCFLKYGT